MEILGIGPQELIFIVIIAIIVLGPKDMQKAGKTIGRWLNQLVRSDGWKAFQKTSREIRNLPNNLMREANLEMLEVEREIQKATNIQRGPSTSTPGQNTPFEPRAGLPRPNEPENTIQPPAAKPTDTPASNENQ